MKDIGTVLQSEEEITKIEEQIQKFMSKYTDQENQIKKLRDEMT